MQNKMQRIDGCSVTTAVDTDTIINNIKENNKLKLSNVTDSDDWRENTPIAIVGGGPSLKHTLKELSAFKYVMACGSVHDFLVKNNVLADWCVVCDPDPLIIEYMKDLQFSTKYFIASQCHPNVFNYFIGKSSRVYQTYIWHAGGDKFSNDNFGKNQLVVGGGCTIGTRAIMLAHGMGFNNLHLFGMDTCLDEDENHHCYNFETKEETIGDVLEITCGDPVNGKKFKVAGYMLGQLFDFKQILQNYGHKIRFTVYGGGVLDYTLKYGEKRIV